MYNKIPTKMSRIQQHPDPQHNKKLVSGWKKVGKKGPVGVHLDGFGHVVVDDQWHILDVDTYEEKIDLFFINAWWTDILEY